LFRYCGEYFDEETGLIYLRNRYYDPSIGRFITEDPIKDGFNWYTYCGNNPVNRWDPWGLEESRDKEVLTEKDYEHIQMLTAIYNYARYSLNDMSIADEAHREAMEIRQKPEYAGIEGYGPVSTTATSNELQFAIFTGAYDDYNYTKSHANVSIVIGEPLSLENVESETGEWIDTMSNAGGFSLIAESFGMDGMIGEFAAFCLGEINKRTNPLYGKVWIGDVVVKVNKTELFHKDVRMRFFFSSDNKSKYYYVER